MFIRPVPAGIPIMTLIGSILTGLTGVIMTLLVVWSKGFFNEVVPSPQRLLLALQNRWTAFRKNLWGDPPGAGNNFRIVLCWLKNDINGEDTRSVEVAFSGVRGIALRRSARIVTAAGAGDEWQPAMERSALAVLKAWNADVALVGTVRKPGEALSLWFVPRLGEGTLERADQPYKLDDVTLGTDFHDDLHAQLTTFALAAVAPLAQTETRGQVLEEGLLVATEKLATLLEGSTIHRPERRASLQRALGTALFSLGEREAGTARLEEAVEAYRAALEESARERDPLQWASSQNNLGNALSVLGEREAGTARLEEAVEAYRAALEERTRERGPLQWASSQNNLGNALRALGEWEAGTARLEEAVEAFRAALEESTRSRVPLQWARTQNNLGTALRVLGEREAGTARLEEAVEAYRAALEESTRSRVPLQWARTQNNLGTALSILGERETGTARLEEAVEAYRAALAGYTREHAPLNWAVAQNNLGTALSILGERETGTARLEEAVEAYRAALAGYTLASTRPLQLGRGAE